MTRFALILYNTLNLITAHFLLIIVLFAVVRIHRPPYFKTGNSQHRPFTVTLHGWNDPTSFSSKQRITSLPSLFYRALSSVYTNTSSYLLVFFCFFFHRLLFRLIPLVSIKLSRLTFFIICPCDFNYSF